MKRNKQKLSMVLALLITSYSIFCPTQIVNAEATADSKVISSESSKLIEDKMKPDNTKILADDELAEVLTERGVINQTHTERLYDKEDDLNTLVYLDNDGSETAYIFNEAVKYVDSNNNIKDKSNVISDSISNKKFAEKYAYVNDKNDINSYFPKTLEKGTGIVLDSKNVSVEMYPNTNTVADVKKQNESLVVYDDVFGKDIQLQYEPIFEGYKENIVLNDDKVNKFSFIIEADGTYLEKNCEAINIVNSETKKTVAVINPIYVYDSLQGDTPEGETHYTFANSMDFSKISDGKYEIVVTVNQEFLSRPTTIYPVYVDPTIVTVDADEGYRKGIEDLPMYNGSAVAGVSAGANTAGVIGYVDSTYGVGRMLMRFPSLNSKVFFGSKYTVSDAQLNLTDVSGQSASATITAYYYGGPTWVEDGLYNSAEWFSIGNKISSATFSYPNNTKKKINLTSAFKKWKRDHISKDPNIDTNSFRKGIILKNTTSETNTKYYKGICTSESTSNKPYVTVKYFFNGVREKATAKATTYPNRSLNCQAYAFSCTKAEAEDFYPCTHAEEYDNLKKDEALRRTKIKMKEWLNDKFTASKWREVKSYDVSLSSDEWLVCMRVGVTEEKGYDYHFWYRASDGKWYNKHGWYDKSRCVEGVENPSNDYTNEGWAYNDDLDFYSSDTVYYAVKAR